MRIRLFVAGLIALILVSCAGKTAPTQVTIPTPLTATPTIQPAVSQTPAINPVNPQVLSCAEWQSWPVIPLVSQTAQDLYKRGQTNGKNPRAFSKVGDGEISAAWFLSAFDLGPDYYDLGSYDYLLPLIEHFAGSYERIGVSARRGFNTQRILDATRSDASICEAGESPLACELRLHQPAFAIVSLGTNQVWQADEFELGMRQILNILLEENVLPILSTKGDNLEGDHHINQTIACLAQEYDLPLWNFWAAIQPLPTHGLQPDLEHLTYGRPDFDDKHAMQSAWTVRNLTALQALDAVWQGVTDGK